MSPSNNNPGVELPPPIVEASQSSEAGNESQSSIAERPAPAQETASGVAASAPLSIPLPYDPTLTHQQQPAQNDSQSSNSSITDDKDLIDKEWVGKAKAIVEKTRNDPYKQSEELTMLRADYMKKQYNKTIRTSK
jgi:ligand-binding sensor protein